MALYGLLARSNALYTEAICCGSDKMIKNDIRHVQKYGIGSFAITLPKDYCEANGIDETSVMRLTEYPHGILITKVEG